MVRILCLVDSPCWRCTPRSRYPVGDAPCSGVSSPTHPHVRKRTGLPSVIHSFPCVTMRYLTDCGNGLERTRIEPYGVRVTVGERPSAFSTPVGHAYRNSQFTQHPLVRTKDTAGGWSPGNRGRNINLPWAQVSSDIIHHCPRSTPTGGSQQHVPCPCVT